MKDKIIEIIKQSSTFEIITHELPDEDAVGSTTALSHALFSIGKRAERIYTTAIAEQFTIPPNPKEYSNEQPEVSFLLDVSDLGMLGNVRPRGKIVVIDHHKSNDGYGDICWVDPEFSSTSEMIFNLLVGFVEITPVIASNLYMGIFGDTGGFVHTNTNQRVFETASELVKSGADAYAIALKLKKSKSLKFYKLLCKALERLIIKGAVFGTYITVDDLIRNDASPIDASGIADEIASIGGSELCIFLRDIEDGTVRCSMRSRSNPAALMTALSYGGGGHDRAAGFTVKGQSSLLLNRIMEEGLKWV
jgi:phosphoesterase RecJ-like protein